MPHRAGPWSLDLVKARLRREQVEREEEASERYRRREARLKEQRVGGTSLSRSVLVVLVLCCVLLSLVVLGLCTVILSLVKKDNEER
jgi:hypothetical protein